MAKVPVVITENVFMKGKSTFEAAAESYGWIVTKPDEGAVAAAVRASGAKAAVLGVERYSGPLYEALAGSGMGSPALIARYGVGYDGIDTALCAARNVMLAITPGALDRSVAEHVFALILSLARAVPASDADLRAGGFAGRQGFELAGKRLAILGFGNIGKQVARIASAGFGMKVAAFDVLPLEKAAARDGSSAGQFLSFHGLESYRNDFERTVADADIVTAHFPVLPSTVKFFNAARFASFKPGSYFVNTGRGRLVDENDVFDALSSGVLAGGAFDVFDKEPYIPCSPERDLRKLGNVVLTPHVASNTVEANANMQRLVLANLGAFFRGDFASITAVAPPQGGTAH